MRRPQLLVATVALAATALATPAGAAATSCNLLKDPAGDAVVVSDSAVDIVSADVASDRRDFTVAIRLADLIVPPATSPVGADYSLQFALGETTLELRAALAVARAPRFMLRAINQEEAGDATLVLPQPTGVTVRGTVDEARNEIRMTVALRDLAKYGAQRRGALVRRLVSFTWRTVPMEVDTFIVSADHAESHKSYRLGTRSCLRPGHR